MNTRKLISMLLSLVMLLSLLAACGSPAPSGSTPAASTPAASTPAASTPAATAAAPVKVGVLLPMSGSSSYYGGVQLAGIEFCVDYVNNTLGGLQGLGGAPIELVIQDSAGVPETGVSAFEKLVEEGVSAVIGPYNSTVSGAVAPLAIQYQVPFMIVNSTSENFMGTPNKYVYRTNIGSSDILGIWGYIVDYLNEARPGNPTDKIAIAYDSGDWGTAALTMWQDLSKELGFDLVISEAVSESTTDLSTLVNKLKAQEVDLIITACFSAATNLLVKQIAEYGCTTAVAGSGGGVGDVDFITNTGSASEGAFYAAPWLPKYGGASEEAAALNQKFAEIYGYEITMEPSWGWLGMAALADALNRAGSADREALADALYATDHWKEDDDPSNDWMMMFSGYEGIAYATEGQQSSAYAGGVRYNNNNRLGNETGMVLVQVQDGRWVVTYPESYNNGQKTIRY